jgi:hypothetical protein
VAHTDWKTTFVTSATRSQVVSHFMGCLRFVEGQMLDDAERCLSHRHWRAEVDLTGVPLDVVDATDSLCARAVGLIEYGDAARIADIIVRILELWQ